MGTKCALNYANIFMGWFEEKFTFPLLTNLSDFYLRFIDDIFLTWNGTKTEFDEFFKKINECRPSIKFEYEMPKTEINFLGTTVLKVDNKLRTKVYANGQALSSTKFATIEAIIITTENNYLTL